MSAPPALTLVVIVPVLNEAPVLGATLDSLRTQTCRAERVVVVDGGSSDQTVEVARQRGAEVLHAGTVGRGNQIAAGVAAATECVVVVGHADMLFPSDALDRVRRVMADDPACPGGALGHRFASPRWEFRLLEWFDARRARRGCPFGDQAQFFRRELLADAGGFPAQPILEDVELAARLRALGVPVYVDHPVTVSPRRFERLGMARTLWQNWQFRRAYRRGGVPATRAIFEHYYPSRRTNDDHSDRSG
ncbi:Glycosyl transferase family 2 OS=Isosphaera pallida (strain ATCC 43644 / DSM 9630 / IS1B) GN=Isop_3508 PE=4 SV=1: Glycos_transf_2 [Gemmataceae bacterium]|nr:Glycosyl transferase family 2 OS=Isosphaera pallida (strain ATCC 43644 / DSM 9630 / IS1B) GN=Isop_3508 PE=4 SV=1: Glycos_transf_2 [Gemmataceae bacterium]VTT99539.1 Glycosyl transferase family 2 OS=Isosphaera pallida (strain ATCC 43644 / DSM 9630 / IS1B) GN=Isop_3508 PE=4 SV=1: Glycos_transf_2 [Gemmataceae bacterium]